MNKDLTPVSDEVSKGFINFSTEWSYNYLIFIGRITDTDCDKDKARKDQSR